MFAFFLEFKHTHVGQTHFIIGQSAASCFLLGTPIQLSCGQSSFRWGIPPPKQKNLHVSMHLSLQCDLGGISLCPLFLIFFFLLIERKWLPYHWGPPVINSSLTCRAGAIAPLSSARCSQSNTCPQFSFCCCVREKRSLCMVFSFICLALLSFCKQQQQQQSHHTEGLMTKPHNKYKRNRNPGIWSSKQGSKNSTKRRMFIQETWHSFSNNLHRIPQYSMIKKSRKEVSL